VFKKAEAMILREKELQALIEKMHTMVRTPLFFETVRNKAGFLRVEDAESKKRVQVLERLAQKIDPSVEKRENIVDILLNLNNGAQQQNTNYYGVSNPNNPQQPNTNVVHPHNGVHPQNGVQQQYTNNTNLLQNTNVYNNAYYGQTQNNAYNNAVYNPNANNAATAHYRQYNGVPQNNVYNNAVYNNANNAYYPANGMPQNDVYTNNASNVYNNASNVYNNNASNMYNSANNPQNGLAQNNRTPQKNKAPPNNVYTPQNGTAENASQNASPSRLINNASQNASQIANPIKKKKKSAKLENSSQDRDPNPTIHEDDKCGVCTYQTKELPGKENDMFACTHKNCSWRVRAND
jgi:hypothetical protein